MIWLMRIGVYGLGRFGAFWSGCLAQYFDVLGYSRNPDRKPGNGVVKVDEDSLLRCDAVFLCVTISSLEELLARIGPKIDHSTTILDTCSVKVYPVEIMTKYLKPNINVIGTHPMFGPDSGQNGLDGLPLVFSPVRVDPGIADFWRKTFSDMGLAVHELSPDEHDREAAYTQGVTHFMGRVLDDLGLSASSIGTLGYTKLLEIIEQTCNDPFQLFVDLQKFNPYTGEMRKKLEASLQKIQNQLGSV